MKLLRYLWGSICHPKRGDFIDMGLGIETRASKFKKEWAKHLELSKQFQRSSFEKLSGDNLSLAVFGAGRLFDLDQEFVAKHFRRVALFDADPLCLPVWKRWQTSVGKRVEFEFHLLDLSGSIDRWSAELDHFLRGTARGDFKALNDFFSALEVGANPLSAQSFDAVLSSNLLGQIPLYWRDRAERMLKREWGIESCDALPVSMAKLQHQHLQLLTTLQAQQLVLTYDQEFMYYKPHLSPWQCESALYADLDFDLPGYNLDGSNSWLWHILPYGSEQADFGSIHSVRAKCYSNNS